MSDSVIDHRRRQNVVRTSVTHSATPRVPLFCSYRILMSSVIYYWTDARQHGIYLLSRSLNIVHVQITNIHQSWLRYINMRFTEKNNIIVEKFVHGANCCNLLIWGMWYSCEDYLGWQHTCQRGANQNRLWLLVKI